MSKKNKHNSSIPQTDAYGQSEGMDTMNVVSDTECTGMIPTPPGGCDDAASYRDIGDIPPEPTVIGDPPKDKPRRKNAR